MGGGASSTAVLIGRGVLLADATPRLRALVVEDAAGMTRRLVDVAGGGGWWYEVALRHGWGRGAMFVAERVILPGMLLHWLARKRLLDEMAAEAVASGCRQMVVLGAGLDTLGWRMQGRCACFEIDHPATQGIKRRVDMGGVRLIAADLGQESPVEALRGDGRYAMEAPTFFVAEGLLMYLEAGRVGRLFEDLAGCAAAGSRFAFSFMEERPGRGLGFEGGSGVVDWWLRWRGEPFRWGLRRDEVGEFAARRGWEVAEVSTPEELRRRYLTPNGLGGERLAIGESVALAYRAGR